MVIDDFKTNLMFFLNFPADIRHIFEQFLDLLRVVRLVEV